MQDSSNSIDDALEILQSCTKPLIWYYIECSDGNGAPLTHIRHPKSHPHGPPVGYPGTDFIDPTMYLLHIPQYTIQNRNVHISVLNGVLWDMGQVHFGIPETGLLWVLWRKITVHNSLLKLVLANHNFLSWLLLGHQWPLLLTWFNFNPSMDK